MKRIHDPKPPDRRSSEQLAQELQARDEYLDDALDDTFPASDPLPYGPRRRRDSIVPSKLPGPGS